MPDEHTKHCLDIINKLSHREVRWALGLYIRSRDILTVAAAERTLFFHASNNENTLGSIIFHHPKHMRLPESWDSCVWSASETTFESLPMIQVELYIGSEYYDITCESLDITPNMEANSQ